MSDMKQTPDESAPEPEAVDDLGVHDDAAEQVAGGATAETQFRGRYQLKLDEAKGLLK
jgi:hypothetical protein